MVQLAARRHLGLYFRAVFCSHNSNNPRSACAPAFDDQHELASVYLQWLSACAMNSHSGMIMRRRFSSLSGSLAVALFQLLQEDLLMWFSSSANLSDNARKRWHDDLVALGDVLHGDSREAFSPQFTESVLIRAVCV
jgi:hypothetical protein